mgnify:CR=1 FL=1
MHNLFSAYLEKIEKAVQDLKNAYIEVYEEEVLTPSRMNLRIRIRFQNNELLELNEAVIAETEKTLTHLSYRYHLQDKNNQLIFRYDNTPHHPSIKSFPHHKHRPDEVLAVYQKPSITDVIAEVRKTFILTK